MWIRIVSAVGFIGVLLLWTSWRTLSVNAQSVAVPPPLRFPDDGEIGLRFEASTSLNSPVGEETLLAFALTARHRVGFTIAGLEGALGGETTVGLSYRNDTSDMSLRVEENRVRIGTVLTLPLEWRVDPYVAGSIATTPTESFIYVNGGARRVAKFWDPIVSTESAGGAILFEGERLDVAARVGLALEQIRAVNHPEKTDDRRTEGVVERYRSTTGIEIAGDAVWQVDSTGVLESRIALFGTFDDLTVWRLHSENRIRVSFAEHLAFTWEVNLTHDVEETLRTQLFSQMAIGVTAPL